MDVDIAMLGTFSVAVARAPVAADAWSRRGAASLVKLLALAEGRTLHREQVIDALWPTVPVDAALPRLHKAAHYARRALGDPADRLGEAPSVVLRNDHVILLPDADVHVDAVEFRRRAEKALAAASAADAEAALAAYGGGLLPEDLYEPWTAEWRETLVVLHRDLLRLARAVEPTWCARTRPTRRRTWRWPASTWRGATYAPPSASWSGWSRRCGASSAPCPAARRSGCERSWHPGAVPTPPAAAGRTGRSG